MQQCSLVLIPAISWIRYFLGIWLKLEAFIDVKIRDSLKIDKRALKRTLKR
jgi:hypothetical protein